MLQAMLLQIKDSLDSGLSLHDIKDDFYRGVIREAVSAYGSQTKAAKALGINRGTLRRYLKQAPDTETVFSYGGTD